VSSAGTEAYLTPEGRARRQIDEQLEAAGWLVQDYRQMAVPDAGVVDALLAPEPRADQGE
jgi:hypothetical protein